MSERMYGGENVIRRRLFASIFETYNDIEYVARLWLSTINPFRQRDFHSVIMRIVVILHERVTNK